jgi:hypothetical protein
MDVTRDSPTWQPPTEDAEEIVIEALRDLARWLYRQLEANTTTSPRTRPSRRGSSSTSTPSRKEGGGSGEVKSVYLTSGRSRVLNLGRQAVELRHAPRWQLALGSKISGQAVRALAWLGPDEAPKALQILRSKLTETAKTELMSAAPQFPTWLARLVGEMVHG